MLEAVGVTNDVVVSTAEGGRRPSVGRGSRDRVVSTPRSASVRVRPADARSIPATPVAASVAGAAALVAAMAIARRRSSPAKGVIAALAVVSVATAAYAAWWSLRPPLDPGAVVLDWRTSALAPVVAVVVLFAFEIFVVRGSLVVKVAWTAAAVGAVAAFSTLRLALVAAAYTTYGPFAFLPAFAFAGTFLDVVPAIAVLGLAHASLASTALGGRRRWLP